MCPRPIDDLGILGTLAACVTTMLGVQAAITLKRVTDCDDTDTFEKRQSKVLSLFARWGMVTIYFLTSCSFAYTYSLAQQQQQQQVHLHLFSVSLQAY